MKPMLASDLDESKLVFPLLAQPKIDGVRAMSPDGLFQGRSGKRFGNNHINQFFSQPEYAWLDGELAGERDTHPDLCRITTSYTSRHDGQPYLLWHVFDYLHPDHIGKPYMERYALLKQHVRSMQLGGLALHLRVVPCYEIYSLGQLRGFEDDCLEKGYEGIIVRKKDGLHKQGRSTVREGGLLRGKRFLDFECTVVSIIEGEHNANEAGQSPHGYIERSTHAENMIPNGMVGAMECRVLADVKDPTTKAVVMKAGDMVRVGAGCMPHDQRKYYFENQGALLAQTIKAKFFPKGIKDKPRFPTYQSHRSAADM